MTARLLLCRLAALCATAAACAGDGATAPRSDEGVPRALVYRESWIWVSNREVRLAGDTVVVTSYSPGTGGAGQPPVATRRVPTAGEWRAFWRAVDGAGVRGWPAACRNTTFLDGGGFSFELGWSSGRRAGAYTNAYPTRAGDCTRDGASTAAADAFRAAVLALGGP